MVKSIRKRKERRGAALIATLFAVAIVLVLGISFLTMAISESRATRTEKESLMALQVANSGLELMLNYMADPNVWESPITEGTNFVGGMKLRLVKYDPADNETNNFHSDRLTEPLLFNVVYDKNGTNIDFGNGIVKPGYVYNITIRPDKELTPDGSYVGVFNIEMLQYKMENYQPTTFVIRSTGKVYRARKVDGNIVKDPEPVAIRTVEMRVRQRSAFDNLQFFQNSLAYDVPGNGVSPPNANDGSNNSAGIPKDFKANGQVVIDGQSDFATETAGYMQFFSTEGVEFQKPVRIERNKDKNVFPPGTSDEDKNKIFRGGCIDEQPSKGLPNADRFLSVDINGDGVISANEQGEAVKLALDTSGRNSEGEPYVKAFYRCGDNDGLSTPSGIVGHSRATDPTQWQDEWGADPNDPYDRMDRDIPADVEFDGLQINSKPGFAKYTVEFHDDGTLTLTKTTAYTKRRVTLLNRVKINRFKNRVLVIEGGNVEVKGTVKGQLTVVAAEHPTREAYMFKITTQSGNTITQSANKLANMVNLPNDQELWVPGKVPGVKIKSVKQVYSKEDNFRPGRDKNSDHIYISRDNPNLPVRIDENGNLTGEFDRVPPYKIGGRWVWPGESSINNTIQNVTAQDGSVMGLFRDIEREGNITIGNDLKYSPEPTNMLGLIAKNYILINDDRVQSQVQGGGQPQINVRAVLMSFDHSLQFDDINMSGKDTWISRPGMNGKFNFTGSMIGQFSDIEGKTDGTGYINQKLSWDPNLKGVAPPNFPTWDVSQFQNSSDYIPLEFVVLSYRDKGAMTEKVN